MGERINDSTHSSINKSISGSITESPNGPSGGKRARPTERESHRRLAGISRTMSGALRRWNLDGMDDEGLVPLRTVCELMRLNAMRATMGDIRCVVGGGGDNAKLRFELSREERCVRFSQGHSSGSGVRPDVLPIARDLDYIIHGTSLSESHFIANECIRKGDRIRVHFYERDADGHDVGWQTARIGSEVSIAVSARQCNGDGIAFYRSPNGVILTEWINGIAGPQYSRYIVRVRRNPILNRSILRGRGRPTWGEGRYSSPAVGRDVLITASDEHRSTSAITRTRMGETMGAVDQCIYDDASPGDWAEWAPSQSSRRNSAGNAVFLPFDPLPVEGLSTPPRVEFEFGGICSRSHEEYGEYWGIHEPIALGVCSARFYITGRGRDALRPKINPDAVGISQDVGNRESNPKRPKPKRETQGAPEPVFATQESIKAGRHVHTAEAEYSRSARSTVKDEGVTQSNADEELSRGSENDDEDMSAPLVTLKPNRRQDGINDGFACNVVSDGPISRTCHMPSEMSAGAGDRAITGSPQLSFDGRKSGDPSNSPQVPPIHGSAYGIATPTSFRGPTPKSAIWTFGSTRGHQYAGSSGFIQRNLLLQHGDTCIARCAR